jgi:hypothetical protein
MNLRRIVNLALAAFVTIGLAVAPLATPALATQTHAAGIMEMSMSADMPCCPDEQESKDRQDCPLVAMCISKTTQAGPAATVALPLRHAIRTTHAVRDDVLVDSGPAGRWTTRPVGHIPSITGALWLISEQIPPMSGSAKATLQYWNVSSLGKYF